MPDHFSAMPYKSLLILVKFGYIACPAAGHHIVNRVAKGAVHSIKAYGIYGVPAVVAWLSPKPGKLLQG